MRLLLSFLLILAALIAALFLHEELTDGGAKTVKAADRQDRARDLLQLRLGEAPILVVNKVQPAPPGPQPEQPPAPDPEPRPKPEPALAPQRFVFLESGGTISELAEVHLGTMRRMGEILELNGWTEDDVRRLHAGTKVLLPTK